MFLSMSGMGSVAGALAVAGLGNVKRKGDVALAMLVCLGASITGFSLSHSLAFSCAMLLFSGGRHDGGFHHGESPWCN